MRLIEKYDGDVYKLKTNPPTQEELEAIAETIRYPEITEEDSLMALKEFYASDYGELYVGIDPKKENPSIYRQQTEFYEKHRTLFEVEKRCEFINEPQPSESQLGSRCTRSRVMSS